ncbi:MAG: TIGR00645 family protein [Alphaproteobacteria bacterium]|nr:TIGR00645 family protein [Alphaproteobacteria bacterium]
MLQSDATKPVPTPATTQSTASRAETLIERTILASRWLLVVFYLGLAAALAVYAAAFLGKIWKISLKVFTYSDNEVILAMLGLIDACLVASLMVMVMLSGYENFVSRLDRGDASELGWLGKIDTGSLKVKVASAIVAISSIHLLQVFLNAPQYENEKIMWSTLIHLAFVASAVFLAIVDRIADGGKSAKAAAIAKPAKPEASA